MFMFENLKKKWSSVYSMLEATGDKEKYQAFMKKALKKFGASSPADLSADKKKDFFNYIDKNWIGDHEEDDATAESTRNLGTRKEALEIGTQKYVDYIKNATPGQSLIDDDVHEDVLSDEQLCEKATTQAQQKLMSLAYAVKNGDIDAPSEDVQKIADSMSLKELKKMAEGKHEDLLVKASENTYAAEALEQIRKVVSKENSMKIDARRKMFKEKIKKLAYEKAQKLLAKRSVEEDKPPTSKNIKNSIRINPAVDENSLQYNSQAHRQGYETLKKYRSLTTECDSAMSTKIAAFIKEAALDDYKSLHGVTSDIPPSAMSIARAFHMSPLKVQEVLDNMVLNGQIIRRGDSYTYVKPNISI